MENLGRFSVSNIADSAPSDSLGVVLVPNGGSYSMMATSSTGGIGGQGGNVPKLGESDTKWQKQATVRGEWLYRRYNGILLVKGPGEFSQMPGGSPGTVVLFRLPEGYRDGVHVTMAPIYKAGNPNTADGSFIRIDNAGNVSVTVQSNSAYVIPTVVVPTGL
ncbi:MAG: hypothetical protein Q4A74_00095 [Cardiobacteriaceae bacterium]|nr:hypothetical protein [Cardiobacteriaceae bacterium]